MKKIISILLSALLIIASLSGLTTVCQALDTEDDTVYPGDQITITYSFAKDIPVGCMDYLFRAKYPVDYVKYKSFKNHWVSYPMVSTNEDEYKDVTASASALSSSEVKAGDKIISFIFDVTKETKLSNLDFSLNELQMYDNDKVNHSGDLSYLTYDVEITSRGEQTTEPTTVQPTTKEPTPATGTVYPGDHVEPTTAKLRTVKGTVKSYLSESDTVTIQLIKSGEVAYETTVKGNNAKYSISGVASGTYTMKVSKNAHADREYTVIVANSDVIRNAKIFAIGDVNSDGDISVVDATLVQKYIVGLENLKDFQKKSADVNDNNEISVVDATLIQKYIVGLDNFA